MRVLRSLSSRLLACGCFVGSYETYDGATVEIVDARARTCADTSHREGARIPEPAAREAGELSDE